MIIGKRHIIGVAALISVLGLSVEGLAQTKGLTKYTKAKPSQLLKWCTQGDDFGCYFSGGLEAKRGRFKDALYAYLIGALNADSRAGFISMIELGKIYEAGKVVNKDLVQAYRWYTVVMKRQNSKDLRVKATTMRDSISESMKADEIAVAEAMAANWRPPKSTKKKKKK
ncbi:MAG: SEL1-like repeat protein [Alphaproteobacteria bacterium]|nr:SEL1-like repeat protein [Alphaproteobacteria bacterium]